VTEEAGGGRTGGLVTLVETAHGPSGSLRDWAVRRIRAAGLLVQDDGVLDGLAEEAPEVCERAAVADMETATDKLLEEAAAGKRAVMLLERDLAAVPGLETTLGRLGESGAPFEVLAGPPPADDDALAVRLLTLRPPGGLLVQPAGPAHLGPMRQVMAGPSGQAGLAIAFLREGPPEATAHFLGGAAGFDDWARAEERALRGLLLLGEPGPVGRASRWFTRLTLLGVRTAVTRATDQAADLAARIRERGGEALLLPAIEIGPPPDWGPLDRCISEIDAYQWLVFTSANAVPPFFDRLLACGEDARALAHLHTACVGPATAQALAAKGLRSDLIPDEHSAEDLAEYLRPEAEGRRFLVPRALKGRDALLGVIREAGGAVDAPPTYENRPPSGLREAWEALAEEGLDALTFASPSAVRHLAEALETDDLGPRVGGAVVACIGPVTASTARRYGLEPAALPAEYTAEGLVTALEGAVASGLRGAG